MRKLLFICIATYWLLGYAQVTKAQTTKGYFGKGAHYISLGNKALSVDKKGQIQWAKKRKSPAQSWKLTQMSEDGYLVYYRLTIEHLGKTKALTVFENENGNIIGLADVYAEDAPYEQAKCQVWAILPANEQAPDHIHYTLFNPCEPVMHIFSYKNKRFVSDFYEHHNSDCDCVWEIVPL
jgi:hypothetical protein